MKEKLFIIFTDLDGTFLPMEDKTFDNLINLIKDIKKNENIHVKICPITGRSSHFTSNFIRDTNKKFKENGLSNIIEFGSSEQGGVVLHGRGLKFSEKYIGKSSQETLNIFKEVNSFIKNSKFNKYLDVDTGRLCSSFIRIKKELCLSYSVKTKVNPKELLTDDEIQKVFAELKTALDKKYKNKVLSTPYNYLFDITIPDTSKDTAIKYILNKYQRSHNLVAFSYSGDAQNDINAFDYVSKLAVIPGIKAHVINPSNLRKCIDCVQIESWKNKIPGLKKSITIGTKPFFEGVIEVLNTKLKDKSLLGNGCDLFHSKDDITIHRKSSIAHTSSKPIVTIRNTSISNISNHLI